MLGKVGRERGGAGSQEEQDGGQELRRIGGRGDPESWGFEGFSLRPQGTPCKARPVGGSHYLTSLRSLGTPGEPGTRVSRDPALGCTGS